MQSNLRFKLLAIVTVILVCVYGIIGLPKSKDELIANWKKNIRLGLYLRGGSYLILQLQVQDAFKAEADQDIERLKEDLGKQGINYAGIERNEPASPDEAEKIQINLKGVALDKVAALRSLINDKYDTWVLASAGNATDFKLTMKPTKALDLRKDTLTRSIHTMESRINGLGLSE